MTTIFVDSNVIVIAFTENKEKEACRKILLSDFVTTTLCLLEAQHAISVIKKNKIYAVNCIKSLFKSSGVIIRLDRNLLFESFKMSKIFHWFN